MLDSDLHMAVAATTGRTLEMVNEFGTLVRIRHLQFFVVAEQCHLRLWLATHDFRALNPTRRISRINHEL